MRCERKHCKMMRFLVLVCALVASTAASPLSLRASPFNPRVVGGQDAKEGQFPYQISLRGGGVHICGGTILNNKWILCAAHCLQGWPTSALQIAVGFIQLNDPSARVYNVAETIVHESYDNVNTLNDISLIRVAEPIEFNTNVQPCELETEDIGADVPVILSGWGAISLPRQAPEVLQWVTLRSITVEECRKTYYPVYTILSSHICTLTRVGEGSCVGDSGGPLVRDGKVCGIVSWGMPCAQGYPDVFTRVSSFVDWINERINN